jgi:O-antigen/teichoic acid export membrane protein
VTGRTVVSGAAPPPGPDRDLSGHARGLARGGSLNLVAAAVNQAAVFLLTFFLARRLGDAEVGLYAQATAFLALLSLLALSGLRAGLTKFVATHLVDGDPGGVRGTVRLGLGLTVVGGVLLGVLLAAFADPIANAFNDPALVTGLRAVGLTLPAAVLLEAALAATQGWRTQKPYALIGYLYEPSARLLLTVLLVLAGLGINAAFVAMPISIWTATIAALVWLRHLVRRLPPAPVTYQPRALFSFSSISWLAALATTGLIWADTLLLGFFSDSAQVGIYNVATRLVMLAAFVMAPINSAFQPYIAHLFHQGKSGDLEHLYRTTTSWIVRLSLPAFIALLVFPQRMLELFGPGFAAGASVTMILALGKLVDAATGPCGLMLNMSGRVRTNMVDNVVALVLNVALNLLLIPKYGINGAAVAWAISLSVVNAARVEQVRRSLGVLPFGRATAKGMAAGLAAMVAALGVRALVPSTGQLLVGLPVLALVYLGVLLALRIDPDDRAMLRAVTARRGAGGTGRHRSGTATTDASAAPRAARDSGDDEGSWGLSHLDAGSLPDGTILGEPGDASEADERQPPDDEAGEGRPPVS